MSKIPKTNAWASGIACLAIAVALVGNTFAQQQSQRDQSDESQQQTSDQQERQRQQQAREREKEKQAREQQQAQKRDQQSRQRDEQTRQRDQQERSTMPQPDRDQFGREQQNRESQFGRESQQFRGESQRSDEYSRSGRQSDSGEAGLGVSILEDSRDGVVIQRVHRGSPAEDMGLETGDRITRVNDREVRSSQEFISRIRNMDPGDEIELEIQRDRDQLTISGELESRDEALVLRGPQRSGQFSQQGRENWQTSYDEQRGFGMSQGRSGQMSSNRIDQIERQVDQLSRELDNLRFALRDIRGQSGQQGRWDRETTARYDEYQRTTESPRRSADRWDDSNRFRQADRSPGVGRSSDSETGQSIDRSRQFDGQSGQRSRQQYESDTQRSGQYDTGRDIRGERQYESDRSGQRSRQSDSDQGARRSRQSDEDRSGPGGEIGEERQRVGAEDIRED